jgi:xylan 1,4-beta-xylosidase
VARSRELLGPYEPDPSGALLTSADRPELTLQKAGHGSLVSTPAGEWYLAHLVGRPYTPLGRCVLGRETAIQPVFWTDDGWPRIPGGFPADTVPAPAGATAAIGDDHEVDDFDVPELGVNWSTLRRPASPEWIDLTSRPSFLRLYGGQSPMALKRPSLVARRVTSQRCTFEAILEFNPRNYRQLAGITGYYNTRNWYYLHVTADDAGAPVLDLLACDSGKVRVVPDARLALGDTRRIGLRVSFDGPELAFAYTLSPDAGTDWRAIGPLFDATTLSDEYAARVVDGEPEAWGFTGAFVGLWSQDLGSEGGYADFDRAGYFTG